MPEFGKIIRFPVERVRQPERVPDHELAELNRWVSNLKDRQNMEEKILYLLQRCGNLPFRLIHEKLGEDVTKVVFCLAKMVRDQLLTFDGGLYSERLPEDGPAA